MKKRILHIGGSKIFTQSGLKDKKCNIGLTFCIFVHRIQNIYVHKQKKSTVYIYNVIFCQAGSGEHPPPLYIRSWSCNLKKFNFYIPESSFNGRNNMMNPVFWKPLC